MTIGVGKRQCGAERTKEVALPGLATREIMIFTLIKAVRPRGSDVEIPCNKNRPRVNRENVLTVAEKATIITPTKGVLQSNVDGDFALFKHARAGSIGVNNSEVMENSGDTATIIIH